MPGMGSVSRRLQQDMRALAPLISVAFTSAPAAMSISKFSRRKANEDPDSGSESAVKSGKNLHRKKHFDCVSLSVSNPVPEGSIDQWRSSIVLIPSDVLISAIT